MGDASGQVVESTPVRKRRLVPGLEDDVDLFFETLAVGFVVVQGRAQGLHFPCDVAAPDAEAKASSGQDVGHGVVFGEPERMPGRDGIEHAAVVEPLGHLGQIHSQHLDVGNASESLSPEVVLGQPQSVVAGLLHDVGEGARLREYACQVLVRLDPFVHRQALEAEVVHFHVAAEKTVEAGNHESMSCDE